MEKIYAYPADQWACGHYRLIWPGLSAAAELTDYELEIVEPGSRDFRAALDERGNVKDVTIPGGAAAVILQRPTHRHLMQTVPILRRKGIAVIVDMDDDLMTIHPGNVAHHIMHPNQGDPMHSWLHAAQACRDATLVTTSTPALLDRYAARGNGVALPNCVPERYLDIPHEDNLDVTWCGSLHSHPNDLGEVRGAIANLVRAGYHYRSIGQGEGVSKVLGLRDPVESTGSVDLHAWPDEVGRSGVTIAPLADTRFNAAKSWLKPVEAMSLGVPVVMSSRVEYTRLHEMSGLGLLVTKPKEWERHLRHLLGDDVLRKEQTEAGREFVRRHLTIEGNAWRWAETWVAAIDHQRSIGVS